MSADTLSIAILTIQGLAGLLTALALRAVFGLSKKIDEIKDQLGGHGADLARGEQRMTDIDRRLSGIEGKTETIQIHGCGRLCTARPAP